jgi:glycosyltransferase involved in cell wall biosynthesis
MKIIYLHQYFTPPHMAGGTRSFSLARRLVEKGHEIHMVTTDREPQKSRPNAAWRESNEAGINVHWTPVRYENAMSNAKRIAAFLKFSCRAAERARKLRGDVIFATSTPLTIALPGVYAAKRSKVPMVFEVRDVWPAIPIAIGALNNPIARWCALKLERFAYQNSAEIIALAPGMKEAVAKTGYPRDRITVIPNGADAAIISGSEEDGIELRAATPWLGSRKLVIYCGALGRVNGVSYLALLAEQVRKLDPEIRFAVIGEGAEEDLVRSTARKAGVLDETFFMLGTMPKTEVSRWLSASTITTALFTGPRVIWKDATQNKFFDSLAAGKPVANNFDGWQCQIAEKEQVGIVLSATNLKEAAAVLVGKISDSVWMENAAIRARQLASTRFSMDAHAVELEKVLERVVASY